MVNPSIILLQSWSALPPILLQADPGLDLAEPTPGGMNFGAVFWPLVGILVVVAVGAGVFFAVKWYKANSSRSNSPLDNRMLNRDTRRRIDRAMADKDFDTVGDLYSRASMHGDAGEAYAKGGNYIKAARAFHTSGNRAQAIHYYKQAGEYVQAARLYAEDGQNRAAAAEYFQGGDLENAGEQYELGGDSRRAAECFEKASDFLRAGKNYERAEQASKAAECYSRYLETVTKSIDGEDLDTNTRELARKTGEFLKLDGKLDEASVAFRRGGFYEEAAECLRTTGDYTRAAEMLIEANQPMLAARFLEEAGEEQRAFKMRAQQALKSGDKDTAAQALKQAGELHDAAELFEQVGKFAEAAAIYEELESYEDATELFVKAGKFGNAARCAEALGQTARAADLFEQAGDFDGQLRMLRRQGDFFKAGRLLYEHRQFDEALKVLENIDSREPLYPKSIELQGDILRSQGRHEKAYSRYRAALGTREVDIETVPLFYKMARSLEEVQDLNGAMQNYAIVTEIDNQYEDAGLRLKALRERQRRNKKTTSSGIFSTTEIGGEGAQRYEIVEEIARGGMGIVYKARDTVLGRIVAYKILGENLRDNETAVKYFLREARAAAALSHPNIVTIFDAGEQEGEFYMAMEFVEGTTLKELIRRTGALPDEQVRYIIINSCRALQYAHSKGVIHRDIKSGNVMITRDKTLKIMDFGLAKFLREYQNNHTQQVGTPFYMSPEQIIGKDIDFRSDLYSLGCMAFECATGTVPFFKGDLSYHHLHTPPPQPRSINPALSVELEKIILKLLEKDPAERFQSASDVIKRMT
ncbi:MAG: protein kinase [Myxococcota bacterium]|jgi:tetratricopeptide (TPR) repeat protein|nr:protein kinase [Myxococcota bacterium]